MNILVLIDNKDLSVHLYTVDEDGKILRGHDLDSEFAVALVVLLHTKGEEAAIRRSTHEIEVRANNNGELPLGFSL